MFTNIAFSIIIISIFQFPSWLIQIGSLDILWAQDNPKKAPIVKIADFDIMKEFKEDIQTYCCMDCALCGTQHFRAPEVLYDGGSMLKSDIFSSGVTFADVILGIQLHTFWDDKEEFNKLIEPSKGTMFLDTF